MTLPNIMQVAKAFLLGTFGNLIISSNLWKSSGKLLALGTIILLLGINRALKAPKQTSQMKPSNIERPEAKPGCDN